MDFIYNYDYGGLQIMLKRRTRNISLTVLGLALMTAHVALADEGRASGTATLQTASQLISRDGFIVTVPVAPAGDLMTRIGSYRTALTKRKEILTEKAEDAKPTAKDAVITVLMPGGLLYAAHRTRQYQQAQQALAEVDERLAALAQDLTLLRNTAPVVVARQAK
jgi:hypothetical protein